MLKILLCDDDRFFLSLESDIIAEIIDEEGIDASAVGRAGSAAEAFAFLKNNPDTQLVFLDIDLGGSSPNGVDVSAGIRQKWSGMHIVFTTNHKEMSMNVLKSGVEPFGFIEKGTDIKRLTEEIRRYIRMVQSGADTAGYKEKAIKLTVGSGEEIEIGLSSILYLETEKNISHGITYHTVNNSKITIISTLEDEKNRLGEGFMRVHRSYLVAKRYILDLQNGYLVLCGQQEIPCAFRMRAEVKKWLNRK